jgi:hypothetical protein
MSYSDVEHLLFQAASIIQFVMELHSCNDVDISTVESARRNRPAVVKANGLYHMWYIAYRPGAWWHGQRFPLSSFGSDTLPASMA